MGKSDFLLILGALATVGLLCMLPITIIVVSLAGALL